MKFQKIAAVAAVVLSVAAGSAVAAPKSSDQNWAQAAADLANPANTTYVPVHK